MIIIKLRIEKNIDENINCNFLAYFLKSNRRFRIE